MWRTCRIRMARFRPTFSATACLGTFDVRTTWIPFTAPLVVHSLPLNGASHSPTPISTRSHLPPTCHRKMDGAGIAIHPFPVRNGGRRSFRGNARAMSAARSRQRATVQRLCPLRMQHRLRPLRAGCARTTTNACRPSRAGAVLTRVQGALNSALVSTRKI